MKRSLRTVGRLFSTTRCFQGWIMRLRINWASIVWTAVRVKIINWSGDLWITLWKVPFVFQLFTQGLLVRTGVSLRLRSKREPKNILELTIMESKPKIWMGLNSVWFMCKRKLKILNPFKEWWWITMFRIRMRELLSMSLRPKWKACMMLRSKYKKKRMWSVWSGRITIWSSADV